MKRFGIPESVQKENMGGLYRDAFEAVHDVLIHEWDPIGVGDEPMVQDEYDSYIPCVLRMLADERDERVISDYLEHVETVTMGLSRVDGITQRNCCIARRLREVTKPFQTAGLWASLSRTASGRGDRG